MGKLAQTRKLIQEAKNLVQEFERELTKEIEEYNLALEEVQVQKEALQTSLQNMETALEGIQNLPEVAIEPVVEVEGEELSHVTPPSPYTVQEPTIGSFAAKFWGVIATIFVFAALGLVGAVMQKLTIDPQMIDMKFIEQAFGFYGALIVGSSSQAAWVGIGAAALVSLIVGWIVYLIVLNSAAAKNLQLAQQIYEEAKEYIQSHEPLLQKIKNLKAFLQESLHKMRGLRILDDEFGARVHRARFFEGEDFEQYQPLSRDEVSTLLQLRGKTLALLQMRLVATQEGIVPEIREFFESVAEDIQKIKEWIYRQ